MKKLKFTFKTRLLVLGMFLFFLFPTGIFAQQQISLKVSQEKISDVLEKIQRQTSYSFIYNNTLIDVDKPVSLSLENASISDALDRLFEKTDIGYKIVDFQITLFPKEFGNAIMSGEIVDNDNLPLAGVTIQNLRTKEVAFSDMDGNYAIEAEEGDDILFSCIGMKDRTVKAAPGRSYAVVMDSDSELLDELIVVGYGSAKKISSIVGAATTVKKEIFQGIPAASSGDALQGQVAGLQVFSSTGEPGSDVTMRLRGVNSINASNTPLFILDGAPVDVAIFTSLNPNDIENITVLKDASSAAIYGSRAANGVIYITTKKGQSEKTTVTVNASYGFSNIANYGFDLMNSEEWFAFRELTNPALLENAQFQEMKNFRLKNDITFDWLKWIIRENAPTWKADLSISGRTEKLDYYISLGTFDQQGNEYYSYLTRYNLRSNMNVKVTDWLKMGTNITLSYQQQSEAGYSTTSTGYYNPMNIASWCLPYAVPYEILTDDNGNFIGYGEELDYISDIGMWNYFHRMDAQPSYNNTARMNVNIYEEITPIEGLTLRAVQAVDAMDYRYTGKVLPNDMGLTTLTEERFRRFYRITSTNTAEYKFMLGEKNHFNILGGHESIITQDKSFGASSQGQSDIRMTTVAQGTTADMPTYSFSATSQNSFFVRLSYDYDNKYYLDGTFRTDGSSLFGENNKYANFYSVGAMWNIKAEPFMQSATWLDNLQLKLSYGTMGNSGIDNYLAYGLTNSGLIYDGMVSWYLGSLSNQDLTWETLENLNVGVNATFFRKLSVNVEFYNKMTKNMLMYIPYSFQTGFAGGWGNIGNMRNRGVDLEIKYDIINKNDLFLGVSLNMNYNKNEITELFGGRSEFVDGRTGIKYEVGKPYGEFYYVKYAGVDPATGKQLWYDKDGNITDEYSESDAQFLGKQRFAPWSGGLNINFGWKNITLNATFSGVFGKYIENYGRYFIENDSFADESNMSVRMKNIWTTPGQITDIPRAGEAIRHDSRWIDNASFVRLKNVQIGYSLPSHIIQKSRILSGLKIYATGRNLLTFTKYDGIDPEVDDSISSGNYPNSKQIVFGLEVTF